MFDKFGEFDSAEEINRAAAAQLKEGDLDAIKTIAEENGLDPEDAEDFCTGATEKEKRIQGGKSETRTIGNKNGRFTNKPARCTDK